MKKGIVSFLVLLSLFVAGQALAASWVLYDDFKSEIIDPDRWFGQESGNVARESARSITSQKLNLLERGYGDTDSNAGLPTVKNMLYFTNSTNIVGIKATVKLLDFEVAGCADNTSPVQVFARLMGYFFNSGVQVPDSAANEIFALIGIRRISESIDADDTARVEVRVKHCVDDECRIMDTLFTKDLGTIKKGQQAALSMTWDKTNHKFIFQRDSQKTVAFAYDTNLYPDTQVSSYLGKRLDTYIEVPNCMSTPRPTGYINVLFDNVYIRTLSP
jgi:hypothetical protein